VWEGLEAAASVFAAHAAIATTSTVHHAYGADAAAVAATAAGVAGDVGRVGMNLRKTTFTALARAAVLEGGRVAVGSGHTVAGGMAVAAVATVPGTPHPLPAPLPDLVAGPVATMTDAMDTATRSALEGAGLASVSVQRGVHADHQKRAVPG